MAKKKPLTLETEFPRSWEDEFEDGVTAYFITQPYIVGLYVAMNVDGMKTSQMSIAYNNTAKFIKNLRESKTVKNLSVSTLGSFLDQSDLDLINN